MCAERGITRKRRGITVAPSPFNRVKFELGVILISLPLAWLVVERLINGVLAQFAVLFSLACLAGGWLVWRTRTVLRRVEEEQRNDTRQE